MSHSHSDLPDLPRRRDAGMGQRPALAKHGRRELPRFNVVLHRDANELMYIVRSVMELTRFPRAESTHKMWEAVHHGRSIVLTTYLERAELFVEQFANKGLKVTVEPA
jgi:ATP-dependent Clp protease adaptor protein ClpS